MLYLRPNCHLFESFPQITWFFFYFVRISRKFSTFLSYCYDKKKDPTKIDQMSNRQPWARISGAITDCGKHILVSSVQNVHCTYNTIHLSMFNQCSTGVFFFLFDDMNIMCTKRFFFYLLMVSSMC